MSDTFCEKFGLDPATVVGREMLSLGDGEWDILQLRSLLVGTISGSAAVDAYELTLRRRGGDMHLILNARLLDHAGAEDARLMLSVSDVTATHRAELERKDLIREKLVLLQELQHRVANSLQIIASVLMQSARRVHSDEARTHLSNAHHRVMSLATLQRQLATTSAANVALRPYFTDLCNSIGASMIADQHRLRITATVDDSSTTADASVSLGLIMTELVINALKHAFPKNVSKGTIAVSYASDGNGWTLTVADDGVGMPGDHVKAVPGLGTGIVEALSRQLHASFEIRNARPGTVVSVVHASAPPLTESPQDIVRY